MQAITPNLGVKDIKKSVEFYCDVLGFEPVMFVPEDKSSFAPVFEEGKRYIFGMVKLGEAEIMLQEQNSLKEDIGDIFDKIGASLTIYLKVDDVDTVFEKIKGKAVVIKEPETTWYGMRELYIRDVDGYVLCFGTQVEQEA